MKIVKKRKETFDNFVSALYEDNGIMWFDGDHLRYRTKFKLSEAGVEVYRRRGEAGWYILGDKTETRYPTRRVAVVIARLG
jgi:hypothetical protein